MVSYQVRFSVLQAGVYGSPQNRRRVIFWGALRGLPLPEFPIPTHNFISKQWAVQLDTGLKLDHVTRDPDRPHRGAPLRAVTVDDVISDLVRFSVISYVAAEPSFISPSRPCFCCVCVSQPKFDWSVLHLLVVRVFVI
jgi:DNA (cytosine-5)-methyltransferase 1